MAAGAAAVALAGVGFAVVRLANPRVDIPTALVTRGEFVDYLELHGQLKALKSVSVNAPEDAEDLQILRLARSGSRVNKGDVVVQFDVTKLQQELAEDRSALRAAEAEIKQTQAQSRIVEEQDSTDLLKARYDVESSKLDASKQEVVSKIEGEEAGLQVADSESKLKQTEQKLRSDQSGAAADLDGKKQKYDKALYDVQQAERKIASLTLRAPSGGVITLLPNYRASGVFGRAPDFKEGDGAWPGAAIVEIPDLSTLRVEARIDETDRARVSLGQAAAIRLDAVPDRDFRGSISRISTLATADFSAGWPFPRNFDIEAGLDSADARLRPGMNATARVAVERIPNAILIPAGAAFQKSGETLAYVRRGREFEARTIQVARRGESQLMVSEGLRPGDRVALKDPTEKP